VSERRRSGTRMSPTLTAKRPSAERRRPEQLCDRHRTADTSSTRSIFQTTGFVAAGRRSTQLTMKNQQPSPDQPPIYICRLYRWKDEAETGLGRIHADGGPAKTTTDCRQRRCRSTGALTRMISVALRLLLVVAVLSGETRADPLHRGREHRSRDTVAAQRHRRPPPFSVNTYDEAVVSRGFFRKKCSLFAVQLQFLRVRKFFRSAAKPRRHPKVEAIIVIAIIETSVERQTLPSGV